jgi:hypothetical protein
MQQTKIYAQILEYQGFKQEALNIYQNLAKKYPKDKEILEAIKRLTHKKKFKGVNIIKLNEFNNLNQINRFEFEKWLSEF